MPAGYKGGSLADEGAKLQEFDNLLAQMYSIVLNPIDEQGRFTLLERLKMPLKIFASELEKYIRKEFPDIGQYYTKKGRELTVKDNAPESLKKLIKIYGAVKKIKNLFDLYAETLIDAARYEVERREIHYGGMKSEIQESFSALEKALN